MVVIKHNTGAPSGFMTRNLCTYIHVLSTETISETLTASKFPCVLIVSDALVRKELSDSVLNNQLRVELG